MTRAAVTWIEEAKTRLAPIREVGDNIISRSPDATVVLSDRTVSRSPHAVIRFGGSAFTFEHLREGVTPSRVNNLVVSAVKPLSDGDILTVGAVELHFMDLASGDQRSSYVQCSNPRCRRRNGLDRTDCWYCGENLANADSVVSNTRRVSCRLVAPNGVTHDLLDGQNLALSRGGELKTGDGPGSETQTNLEASDGALRLRLFSGSGEVRLNGGSAVDGTSLATGDRLSFDGQEFLCILRDG